MEIDAYLFAARRVVNKMGIDQIFAIAEAVVADELRKQDAAKPIPPKTVAESCVNTILFAENSKR